jgi:alcohol dehydrogenase
MSAVPTRDIPRHIALYRRERLRVDRLENGTLNLEEINEGFDNLHEGMRSARWSCSRDE